MREKNIFKFKQFAIRHEHAAMKVGTDGVLLGAWTSTNHATRILDIGTGTGLIALMLAQRTTDQTKIEAIEIEQHAYEEACTNVEQSPWKNRIQVFHQSLQDFSSKPFDLIVCNPPFFNNSLKPPDGKRILARHADTLPMHIVATHCKQLLNPNGIVSMIIPCIDQPKIESIFLQENLHCFRTTYIKSTIHKNPERCLVSFDTGANPKTIDEIVIIDGNGNRTKEYTALTKDFYLKL